MKSALAKARDKWLVSDEGKKCCHGTATGQYLQNRLVMAFLAGANFSVERIKELEAENERLKAAIEYAQGCGIMTETVCRKFEQALKVKGE